MKMNHVGISVSDIERTIAFYRDMFGMEQSCEVFPFGGSDFSAVMRLKGARGRMCMISGGDVSLELFEFANPVPRSKSADYPVADHGYSHFAFAVEDIESVYARLIAAGVTIHCPVTTFAGGMKAIYARDPDGNVFELLERVAAPPERTQHSAGETLDD
jgi:catechol 2,3-dioxygenase-like lactoylglutathione lyase family enzyme